MAKENRSERVRYGVVGLGYFAQNAILPAFKRARNSELVAIVSGDPEKRDVLIFDSVFAMQVREGNSRTFDELGGGPLNDVGIYCVNAARYVFRSEPTEVMALSGTRKGDERFSEIDEHIAAMLRFPGDRIATFVASFGSSEVSCFEIVGTTEESAYRGERVTLLPIVKSTHPDLSQEDHAPAHGKPRLVHSEEPSS